MRRDMTPGIEGTMEAGWGLLPDFHGRGYASEALGALWPWVEAHHPDRPITCIIDPENTASLTLAMRHGFRSYARSVYHNSDVVLLQRSTTPLNITNK